MGRLERLPLVQKRLTGSSPLFSWQRANKLPFLLKGSGPADFLQRMNFSNVVGARVTRSAWVRRVNQGGYQSFPTQESPEFRVRQGRLQLGEDYN